MTGFAIPFATCATCGKKCYVTKAVAKRAARQFIARDGRLTAYKCGTAWHIGHLPKSVVTGSTRRANLPERREERAK